MSGVRWDMLANGPDVAGSVMRGFDDGMKRRAQLETQRAMAALQHGPNPEAMRTLYTYNPQLAMQVEDQMYQRGERHRDAEGRNARAALLLGANGGPTNALVAPTGGANANALQLAPPPDANPSRPTPPQAAGQQQDLTEYAGRVAQWADTPEKWDQAVDYLAQNGLPNAARFKGQFSPELRAQLMAQAGIEDGAPQSQLAGPPPEQEMQTPSLDQQGPDAMPLQAPSPPEPQRSPDYERAIRADPDAFLTFQGKRLDVTAKQFKNISDLHAMAMQLVGGVHDQATYDAAKQQAAQLYSSFGHDASEFLGGLPAQYSPETIKMLQFQGMDTSKQLAAIARENNIESQIEVREGRLDEYTRHNRAMESNVRRGQDVTDRRVRSGAGRRPTPTAVIGRIMDKQARGEKLSGAERQVLEEHRAGKGRGGKSNRSDLIGQVYQRGGVRVQYSKSKGGYVDISTGELVK